MEGLFVCPFIILLAAQKDLSSSLPPSRSSPSFPISGALLALAEWFLLLLLFRRRFGLEDGYQSFRACSSSPLRRGRLILSPFFARAGGSRSECAGREEGGRKGINISESRSLRRKLEELDVNVTLVRSLVPSLSIIFKESQSGRRTAQGPNGERPIREGL